MENTIDFKEINNRKIIFEVRYVPNPIVVDKRGSLLNKFIETNIIVNPHWELGTGEVRLSDNSNSDEARLTLFNDIHRLLFVSSNISSNDSYFHIIEKVYKAFKEVVGDVDITRIGCRILGTYKSKSNDYKQIVEGFKSIFPSQTFLEDFNVNDMRLTLIYQNGQYNIGPCSKSDSFVEKEFTYTEAAKVDGFAIDTDNYILNQKAGQKINDSVLKDVFVTSLSVEKSLYEKLRTL